MFGSPFACKITGINLNQCTLNEYSRFWHHTDVLQSPFDYSTLDKVLLIIRFFFLTTPFISDGFLFKHDRYFPMQDKCYHKYLIAFPVLLFFSLVCYRSAGGISVKEETRVPPSQWLSKCECNQRP